MASFPELNLAPENFKIRFREEYASEVLNQRFLSEPGGVYFGFTPLVAGSTVSLLVDPTRSFSLLRVISTLGKTSLDVYFPEDLALDFTGHDFVASGDLYVIATVSYVRGGTTSSRIFTRTTPANGLDEINICRLSGTGAPGTITAFTTLFQDRTSILAVAGSTNPFGYMPSGSVEDVAAALAGLGNCDVDTTVRLVGFNVPAADAGSVFLLDMAAIVANADVLLPASAVLNEGDSFGFFSLTGIPGGFDVRFTRDGADEIIYNGALATQHLMRKHVGAFIKFTLIKTGVTNPTWFVKVMTIPSLHAFSHLASGDDEILLDTLGEPTDNTNLDATIGRHGLLPKLSNVATEFLNGVGGFAVPLIAVPNPFGDGSDGVVTIAAPTTLTRAMFYEDLTVDPGITLITDGFPIFVRGTLTNDGTIANNGADGADNFGGGVGGVGGKGYYGVPGNVGGDAGFIPGSGNTTASTLGGDGGGAIGGLAVASPILMPRSRELAVSGLYPTGFTGTPILINGGAGGQGNDTSSDPGEGGGGGGGVVTALADILINNGVIEAKGGNTGNSFGVAGSFAGSGGGGLVILVYGSKSGAGTTSVIAGMFGTPGSPGTVIEIPVV
jgi:hypothetical protein